MKVTITRISGFAEAFEAMFMSKRSWTPELAEDIRMTCDTVEYGAKEHEFKETLTYTEAKAKFDKWLGMLLRMGKKHITLLRYIDVTIMTEGLHRAGQD